MTFERRFTWCLVAAMCAGVAGCGNYSNDDLDFQLALPQETDLRAKLQPTALRVDSAEYYKATRSAVTSFNAMAMQMLGLVEAVRGYTPTSRQGNTRTWGPFADENHAGWLVRVVMARNAVSSTLLQMDYAVEVAAASPEPLAWAQLLVGRYESQGSARNGAGEIHFLVQSARQAGYPADTDPGVRDLDHIDVTYSNAAYPITVAMTIVNLPTAQTQSGYYTYAESEDGSGAMGFEWQGVSDGGILVRANMTSRWLGSGAGRADLVLAPKVLDLTLGTDCWGADTVATYSYRRRDDGGPATTGDIASCLF